MNNTNSRVRVLMAVLSGITVLALAAGCAPGVPPSDVTTLAGSTVGLGDGTGPAAQFNSPASVAVAPDGTVYVADTNNHRIRTINPNTGQVTTLAGTGIVGHGDGPGTTAKFAVPLGVAVGPDGTVYVADTNNHRIRTIDPNTGQVATLAGGENAGYVDGPADTARFNSPTSVAAAPNGTLFVADNFNNRIRAVDPLTGEVSTLAGGTSGFADGTGATARFFRPLDVAVAPNGTVYVADYLNHRVRSIDPLTGEVTTLAGSTPGYADGPGGTAQFVGPSGVEVASNGTVYVADRANERIRAIDPATGLVSTFAGSGTAGSADGPSLTAQFDGPTGVAVAPDGTIYVADLGNHRIRKITPTEPG